MKNTTKKESDLEAVAFKRGEGVFAGLVAERTNGTLMLVHVKKLVRHGSGRYGFASCADFVVVPSSFVDKTADPFLHFVADSYKHSFKIYNMTPSPLTGFARTSFQNSKNSKKEVKIEGRSVVA